MLKWKYHSLLIFKCFMHHNYMRRSTKILILNYIGTSKTFPYERSIYDSEDKGSMPFFHLQKR